MCKDTSLEETPWICVKYWGSNFNLIEQNPIFIDRFESYEFAVAVVENKPVFVGDKVFIKDNKYPEVNWNNFEYWKNQVEVLSKDWTWKESKKTFMLNGREVPCPSSMTIHWKTDQSMFSGIVNIDDRVSFHFDSDEDAEIFKNSLFVILKENIK